jgi:hypothetical protein
MRIRVPGRFMAAVAILAVFLCLLPASTKVAVAKPVGWIDVGPVPPADPTGGDNDGVVLKSKSAASPTVAATGSIGNVATRGIVRSAPSRLRMILAVLRLNWPYWLR